MDAAYAAVISLSKAQAIGDLILVATRWATTTGFDRWSYGIGAPANPQVLGTYPEVWTNNALGDGGFTDPILRAAIKRDAPLVWNLSHKESLPSGMTVRESRMVKDCWDHGLRSGITLATRSNSTAASCILSVCSESCTQDHLRVFQEPAVVMVAHFFREAVRRVLGEQVMRPDSHGLVEREIQCLQWAMEGKTNDEIGVILEIKGATVNFHLGNAAKKLGTSGRMQTFAAALRLGVVDIWSI